MLHYFNIGGVPAPKGSVSAFPIMKKSAFPVYSIKELYGKLHINISHGKKAKEWEKKVREAVEDYTPLEGPLGVNLTFYLPRPKTVKRKDHTVKPDIDKLERAVLDGLKHILGDDSHIVDIHTTKVYESIEFPVGCIGVVWECDAPKNTIQS